MATKKKTKRKVAVNLTEPFVDVDGVRYISSATAMDMFNLSESAWTKKRRVCNVEGRRLSSSNALYYTMEEAEEIVNTANYRSCPPTTYADWMMLITDGLAKISERFAKMDEMGMLGEERLGLLRSRTAEDLELAKELFANAKEEENREVRIKRRGRRPKNNDNNNNNKEE